MTVIRTLKNKWNETLLNGIYFDLFFAQSTKCRWPFNSFLSFNQLFRMGWLMKRKRVDGLCGPARKQNEEINGINLWMKLEGALQQPQSTNQSIKSIKFSIWIDDWWLLMAGLLPAACSINKFINQHQPINSTKLKKFNLLIDCCWMLLLIELLKGAAAHHSSIK